MTAANALKTAAPTSTFDVERYRADFPILANVHPHGKPLIYLDNGASSQMPQQVIDRLVRYQTHEHANIHRGVHTLSETATRAYEHARKQVQHFLNAKEDREIVFTSNVTDSINLVAHGFGRAFVGEGDEVIITHLEHHANIVPWQMLCEEKGAKLKVVPIDDSGALILEAYEKLFSPRTKLVSVTHVSNALGTINPVKEMIEIAHRHGVPIMIDGAQAVQHMPVDVQALDCDFYAFTGHKVFGPTGIGVLYGKAEWLNKMKPFRGGGDMILSVTFEKTTYNAIPFKFEAGTPPIAQAIALGEAVEYVQRIGLDRIAAHEHDLLTYATERLQAIDGVRIYGTAQQKAAVVSFYVNDVHPHDVGTLLNEEGVAVRTGHHCAQPVMQRFGIPATARASFAFYNKFEEVDALAAAIRKVQKLFA
ncbi:MAG: cysteine desulfurase [Burkholderiales bacterium]|nr:cysteine desulfurase [Burkholderiales bacterium]